MRAAVGRFLRAIWSCLAWTSHAAGTLLRHLSGLSWHAPWWMQQVGRGLGRTWTAMRARPRASAAVAAVLAAALAAGGYGWIWYKNLPQPHTVAYDWKNPPVSDYREKPVKVQPLRVQFRESVAPLQGIGQDVAQGLRIEPALAGKWRWASDRLLTFEPEGDWPIGARYRVTLDKKGLLADGVLLEHYAFDFATAPFAARLRDAQLYQDPVNPGLKQLVATLNFSHPVDEASVRRRISVSLGTGLTYRQPAQASAPDIEFDQEGLNAYVRSAPLATPLESTAAAIEVGEGISPKAQGQPTTQPLSARVTVPGRYQLGFDQAQVQFVDNDRGESEPVLMFTASSPVADEAVAGKVHAWLLPERDEPWSNDEVDEAVLARASRVPLVHVPGEHAASAMHAFKFRAPPGRALFVKVDARVEAAGGYLARDPTYTLLEMPEYPRMLRFLSQGALLPLGGDRRLGFMSRGVPGVRMEIARVLPGELHHLVDQSTGTLARPQLPERSADRLLEREQRDIALPAAADPARTYYDFLDLSDYLRHDGGRRGLFVVRLSAGDRPAERTFDGDETGDLRFIAVTDLGIIAKRSADGSHDVYVQSIAAGTPVAGASVQVIGRNGLPVAEQTTDSQGRVHFEALDALRRERVPLMYVVSLGEDLSFLPVARAGQHLDLSRFDVGGIGRDDDPDGLHAYLFSDRGLYRPGETAHLGMIVRRGDWRGGLQGLPVELDVRDPRGATVLHRALAVPASGFDSLDFTSTATAPAGTYQAVLTRAGKDDDERVTLGTVAFSVRDFEPDRMKVSLALSPEPVRGWISPGQVQAQVSAEHLFGAPASDRRVSAEMSLSPAFAEFTGYEGYRFPLEDGLTQPSQEELAEAHTDAQGRATLALGLERFADAAYRLQVLARVFEAEGGRNVAAESSVIVSAAPWLVGVKSLDPVSFVPRGAARRVHWQAVSPDLSPRAVPDLRLRLVEHRHVSVLVRQPNGTHKYESRLKDIAGQARPLALPAGGAETALDTSSPGDFSLVLEDGDGKRLNRVDYSVAGQGNVARALDRNAELQLRLDKRRYRPGEEIAVGIRAPYAGAGLITIERDRIYAQQWFRTADTSSVQHIRLPEGLEGNAYVNVQFVRDPGSSEVYMSPLSYGVAAFGIDRQARQLPLALEVPDRVEPGQALEIKVQSARPSRAVVFAVDEGILQVARYRAPDPLGYFFRKRALEVDTSQILDQILPQFSRLLEASAPGGDSDAALEAHLNPFKRKHKPPVAWWSRLVDLPAGQTVLRYDVPDYFNGRLRLYAVAVDDAGIGVAQATADVRGPLVVTPNVPAFVAPGDDFLVTVGVYSNLPQAARVRYRLETDEGLAAAQPAGELELQPNHEGTLQFRVRAGERLGSAGLRWRIDLPDGRQVRIAETVSVRPASVHRVQLALGSFTGDGQDVSPARALYPQLRNVRLSLDASPLAWAAGLQQYLDGYAYGCTEQIVSRAMPALLWSVDRAVGQRAVDGTMQTLRQRQVEEGAFGLWAANPVVAPHVSLYAVDFLLEAKERGYAVEEDLLVRANRYLAGLADGPSDGLGELRERAYAAYLLARQGVVVSGTLADIQERLQTYFESSWRNDLAAVYLAASYKLLKQDREADALLARTPWRTLASDWFSDGPYYDPLVHDAERLTLLARHFPQALRDVPPALLENLGKYLAGQRYNSLSAALLVRALDAYGQRNGGRLELSVQAWSGQDRQALALAGKPPHVQVPLDSDRLALAKRGDGPAFYMLSEAGFDRTPVAARSDGLEVVRDYLGLDGKPVGQVKVGDEFLVRLRMRAVQHDAVSQVAVVDLLPGGVEPVLNPPAAPDGQDDEDADGEDGEASWQAPLGEAGRGDWQPEYADVRDDRVVLYGDLARDASTFVYRVRATNAGTYVTPPAYAEGMYDTALQARGAAGRLEIVAP